MAKKLDDIRAAKERRQKKIAVIGGVVLVALLAFQGPRTLKMLRGPDQADSTNASAVEATPAPQPPTGPVTLTPPQLGTPSPAGPASPAVLADTDPEPLPAVGQLIVFSLFASKDPFVQQVSDDSEPSGGGASAPARTGSDSPARGSQPTFTPAPPGKPTTAVLSVNGVQERVAVNDDFPAEDPVFRLASLTRTEARIGIAGGSLASGDPTVALKKGKALTLMNTANGTRYELRLVSVP